MTSEWNLRSQFEKQRDFVSYGRKKDKKVVLSYNMALYNYEN